MKKGKLIVIDGTDGSGKATQASLLLKRLKRKGYKVKIEDFPQYGKKSAGPVEDYLNGVYGAAKELGSYIPSMLYAVDRFAAKQRIEQNLKKGYIVISNRYVTANMGHQGGKIKNPKAKIKYFEWLFDLEFNFFGIPKPDLNIILHMPTKVAQKLVHTRGKKKDMHEKDLAHLQSAERVYLEIAKRYKYPVIECYEKGKILTRTEIADLVWKYSSKII